jgi:hypothetical protein
MKLRLFVFVFIALILNGALVFAQTAAPIEIISVGMTLNTTGDSYDVKIGLKNVNNKNVEISMIFLNRDNVEIFSWKGFVIGQADEIVVKKSMTADIIDTARYLNLRISNAEDLRNDYIANRFMIPKYSDPESVYN